MKRKLYFNNILNKENPKRKILVRIKMAMLING